MPSFVLALCLNVTSRRNNYTNGLFNAILTVESTAAGLRASSETADDRELKTIPWQMIRRERVTYHALVLHPRVISVYCCCNKQKSFVQYTPG